MSGMDSQQRGALNVLLIPLLLLFICFLGLSAFTFWLYGQEQTYKNDTDQKVTAAVIIAKQQTRANDVKQYAQEAKYPLSTFTGPASFGNLAIKYPKTWSGYVAVNSTSSTPITGYFYPGIVPDITNSSNNYALRVQLLEQSYSTVMQGFAGNVTSGQLKVAPYTLPQVPNAIGSILHGQLTSNNQGSMVVVPILNMTLEVWTEAPQFESDFTNAVLPNVTFQP